MDYKPPPIELGTLSEGTLEAMTRNTQDPIQPVGHSKKIMAGTFVLSDLIISLFKQEKPLTVSILQFLFYALGVLYFVYIVLNALNWIMRMMHRGLRVLLSM